MSIRKEQVLLILVVLLGAYYGQGYFGVRTPQDRSRTQVKEYEAQPLSVSPLVDGPASALVRRDFFTEPSETRPLPPRELAFPPHAAASLAGLPLDPGPDFRHSWMLRQDGEQEQGQTVERAGLDGDSAAGDASDQGSQEPVVDAAAAISGMTDEQLNKIYDRLYIGSLKPNYGRIEPAKGVDLFALEESGNFAGVTLRMRVFSRKNGTLGEPWSFGADNNPITKIQLAETTRNEVTRRVRKVPEEGTAQDDRATLIHWLMQQARSESWIYDEAQKQAEIYLQYCGGNLEGLRIMQLVYQARGDIKAELDLLEGVTGDATAQSFKLQGIGVIKWRLGLWVEAEENLKEAARLTPTNARAHGTLAEFYRSRVRSREALAAAERAEQTLGSVQDEELREQIVRTIMSCRLAVGMLPDSGKLAQASPYMRGCIHYATGNITTAMSAFQQVGPGPDASAAQLGQAACLIHSGKLQEAYDLLTRIADLDPLLRHRALTGQALIFSRVSDFETALTLVDRALEASPRDTYALYLRGRTLRLMGQFAAAEEALTQALVQHDDFVHAIVEMSLVQTGLASQAIGADQAAFLIGARRYMDRAVQLAPTPELELLEMQGMRAFAAADHRAARQAFERASELAASDELKAYAKGALCVVSYSRGRVGDAQDNLERLERDLGRDSSMGKWAGATLVDIADHAEKEALGDSFDREELGQIWDFESDGKLKPQVRDGRMVYQDDFPRNGKGEVWTERVNAVQYAKNFLACSVTLAVGPTHEARNSIVGLGIEIRRARQGVEFSARVGLKDGAPYVVVHDGRDNNGDRIIIMKPTVALRSEGPQALELRVVPSSEENNRQLQLLVYFNDALVMTHELKQLNGSTQTELKTILFAQGEKGAKVDVAFDDYKLERRKGK